MCIYLAWKTTCGSQNFMTFFPSFLPWGMNTARLQELDSRQIYSISLLPVYSPMEYTVHPSNRRSALKAMYSQCGVETTRVVAAEGRRGHTHAHILITHPLHARQFVQWLCENRFVTQHIRSPCIHGYWHSKLMRHQAERRIMTAVGS